MPHMESVDSKLSSKDYFVSMSLTSIEQQQLRVRPSTPSTPSVFESSTELQYCGVTYPIYCGLATLPCHRLVDTGAEDGVIGLWHFQRWCACLAKLHKLRPRYLPVPKGLDAGGIGGRCKILAIADMPMGVAGVSGICRFVIREDPETGQ